MMLDMNNQYGDTIGGRIHWLRKNRGLKIVTIAEQLNLQSSHLSSIENNKVGMSIDTLRRIADVLGSTTDFILLRTDYPEGTDTVSVNGVDAPAYFSPEADEAARMIDAMSGGNTRAAALSAVRTWSSYEASVSEQNVKQMAGLLSLIEKVVGVEKRIEVEQALIREYSVSGRTGR